jgi:hypothetical protein
MRTANKYLILLLLFSHQENIIAQDNLFARYTTKENQEKTYQNLINYTINRNLSLPLNDSTESNWQDAFSALELLLYRDPAVDKKIDEAFASIESTSKEFQRSLLEVAYTNYASGYTQQVEQLLNKTDEPKIFAMSAEYLLQNDPDSSTLDVIEEAMVRKFSDQPENPLLTMLAENMSELRSPSAPFIQNKFFTDILNKNFLPGRTVMYSFQRKDRNYPGLVVIRNSDGKFIRDSGDIIFNVPQLARSIAGLPEYLTNGNSPQGIYKMYGFGVSLSRFIGPSPNIQLGMPGELSMKKFFGDSLINDTTWEKESYAKLLPKNLRHYRSLYHTYFAGLAGRTEIISHGTTINPEYYKDKPFYPLTPSQGCLSTKEIWDGKRLESDQKKLISGLLKAGGANGYCVVVELDDKESPVTIDELLSSLLKAESLQ